MVLLHRLSCNTKRLENLCQDLLKRMEKIQQFVAGNCCTKISFLHWTLITVTFQQLAIVVTFVLHSATVLIVLNLVTYVLFTNTMATQVVCNYMCNKY